MPRGSIFDEKEVDKIGEEGRSICHPSGCDFRTPSTRFGKKNTWNFFGVCTIAIVLFYQCSPYCREVGEVDPPFFPLR